MTRAELKQLRRNYNEVQFTPEMNACLIAGRFAHKSFEEIGRVLGVHHTTAERQARRLGINTMKPSARGWRPTLLSSVPAAWWIDADTLGARRVLG